MSTPTKQQLECYAHASDHDRGSLAIKARAGSGKTSTLRELAKKLPGSGLATSFSRSTVSDLKAAIPSNFDCLGLHALGLRGIKQRFPQIKTDVNGNALYEFVKAALKDEEDGWKLLPDIKRLVEVAALSGIVPGHDQFLIPDEYEEWEALADNYDIELAPLVYETAHAALQHVNDLAVRGESLMFVHMLTLPVFFNTPVTQYPKIIVDEAQDLNPLQHRLVERALRRGGRIFSAGDPAQAIFGFSGAMTNSFDALSERFACSELPLTVSWRCARAIIREAQLYVPDIEWAPNAEEGSVVHARGLELEELPRTILCRNNAPLTKLALRLFVAGYTVECAGKDIGAGLKSTISRIASGKESDSMSSERFLEKLAAWAAREIERRPTRRPRVQDKVEALSALCEHHRTVGAVRKHIDNLYTDPDADRKGQRPADFLLSTIHKAKGREWDRVGFLDSHLIPAKWAKQDWERRQELNLSYVAVTRAKQELVYLNSDDIQ